MSEARRMRLAGIIIAIILIVASLIINEIASVFWLAIVETIIVFVLHRFFRTDIRNFLRTAAVTVLVSPLVCELILVYMYPLASAAIIESFLGHYIQSLAPSIVGAIGGSFVSMVIGE